MAGGSYSHGQAPRGEGVKVVMPAAAPSINQPFRAVSTAGRADPTEDHDGIDIIAPGGTPVIAAASGRVVRSHLTLLRGNRIVLEHGRNEKGEIFRTEYVHLKRRLVEEGTSVSRGDEIGELGMTGMTAGYPHLHYMVILVDGGDASGRGRAVEPHLYWAGGEGVVTCHEAGVSPAGAFPAFTYPVPCRERR